MRIATWNVNSLRVRLPHVEDWLKQQALPAPIDVLGIQETKLTDDKFPAAEFAAAGLNWVHSGQKTYNGVALISPHELVDVRMGMPGFEDEHKRVIAATVLGVRVINVYVPNGQAVGSDKYAYKLRWLEALHGYLQSELVQHAKLAIVGDYNIAPADADVHDPAAWAGQVLCSEAERAALQGLIDLGVSDCFRRFEQPPMSFTWWDYRQAGFRRNLGLRIDHVLASQALAQTCVSCVADLTPRRLERPSDHAPVIAEFAV